MKKARRLLAIFAASLLIFGAVANVYAADYEDLEVTEKTYYYHGGRDYGKYPVVEAIPAVATDAEKAIWQALSNTEMNYGDNSEGNLFKASYTVTDENRYATIEFTLRFQAATDAAGLTTEVTKIYIDKETNTVITEEEYTAGIETQTADADDVAAAPVVEEEVPGEVTLVPLADNATALGYTVTWDAELNIARLKKENIVKSVKVGKNAFVVDGDIIELEAAPSIQDSKVYVPISYFEKVLGATVTIGADGQITIA